MSSEQSFCECLSKTSFSARRSLLHRYPTKAKPFQARSAAPHMWNCSANLVTMMPDEEMGIGKYSCQHLLAEPIFTLGSIQINSPLLCIF